MRTARLITTFTVAGALSMFFACSDSAQPLGIGDMVVNDTAGQDASSPPTPPPTDSGIYSYDSSGPAVVACASCTCDPTKNYCYSGSSMVSTTEAGVGTDGSDEDGSGGDGSVHGLVRSAVPLGAFGEPDGAADAGPPPPPCPLLAARSTGPGCIPLPATCATNATCDCLLATLQHLYPTCYLVCTPTPGFLEVYCGG
jgi:hypothetical protein